LKALKPLSALTSHGGSIIRPGAFDVCFGKDGALLTEESGSKNFLVKLNKLRSNFSIAGSDEKRRLATFTVDEWRHLFLSFDANSGFCEILDEVDVTKYVYKVGMFLFDSS
jgi:hypothetical protein